MRSVEPERIADRLRALPEVGPLLAALAAIGAPAQLVGGVPRDLLSGAAGGPVDLDLVVEGDAPALARELAARLGGTVRTHGRFGTASIVRCGGPEIDVARSRSETYARPGALPDVRPAPLGEDLRRRDFGVNAIAIALDGERLGEVTAAPGALDDLAAGRLRILHEASFRDDPTRLLRLVRYAARLGFEPDDATAAAAAAAVAARAPATVSPARIGDELRLLLAERTADEGLARAQALGAPLSLLGALLPGLRHDRDLSCRALALLPSDGRPELLRLAALGLAVARAGFAAWLDALETERADRDRILGAHRAPALAGALAAAPRPSSLRAAAGAAPPEAIALAGALGPAANAGRWLTELRHVKLQIDGDDLIAAGIPEGPAVGRALSAALDSRLDGELGGGRDAELEAALAHARGAPT